MLFKKNSSIILYTGFRGGRAAYMYMKQDLGFYIVENIPEKWIICLTRK